MICPQLSLIGGNTATFSPRIFKRCIVALMFIQIRAISADFMASGDGSTIAYKLPTPTYGTASAPFTAIRVIRQLAEDERQGFLKAEKILKTKIFIIIKVNYNIKLRLTYF